ncbi:uncharacterized protein isoform X2 [Danio rerio]|uniref:Uncharacterized protein isoform X2 n=1 Tax=Danio rerio TaxID=7955 RepID=A0AC58FYT6_DANRE
MDYRGERNEYESASRSRYPHRPNPPEPSYVSMRSDSSMHYPPKFSEYTDHKVRYREKPPQPRRVSMRSDHSMHYPPESNANTDHKVRYREKPPQPRSVSMRSDRSMHYPPKFSEYTDSKSSGYSDSEFGYRENPPQPRRVPMRSDYSMHYPPESNANTDHKVRYREKPPQPRRVSMRSDHSMHYPPESNANTDHKVRYREKPPQPRSVSMRSDRSMHYPPESNANTDHKVRYREKPPQPRRVSMRSDHSMHYPPESNANTDHKVRYREKPPQPRRVSMRSDHSMHYPPESNANTDHKVRYREKPPQPHRVPMRSDRSTYDPPKSNANTDHKVSHRKPLRTFRSNLLKKFQCLYEGTGRIKSPTLLNEIYTELYITEGDSGEINNEHEVRQIETQSRRSTTEDTPIQCRDIFTALPGQHKAIRTVLTKGVAGIGKTVSVQKFILDWAEEKENQDVQLIFPLPFREINLMKDRTLSLADLLHVFFPETKEMEISRDRYKVLFIFDGLDECRLSLDFKRKVKLCDISESASVEDLLINLIVGNLLPSALIWITSRPAAADLIPSAFVHRLTEVRGFTDPQKEEYFRKRIRDQRLADEIIQHLKSCRSLFIMCHIPVFCWISATVLEDMMRGTDIGEIPKTLTEMYTHFLIIQTSIRHERHYEKKLKDEEMILKLGKLAFRQLMKGNLIFYEEDLRECGIDESEASVYSGLCTQIFREELGLFQGKVFCFVHLSIQEHLAALYVLLSFLLYERDELSETLISKIAHLFKRQTISDLHQSAVDKALQSRNGHLDLFLRFLLGLSLKSNQTLLKNLLTQVGNISYSEEKTVEYIKTQIKLNPSPEKSINLFHCLNELGDHSLVNEVQEYFRSGDLSGSRLSSSQWSAVVFVLLTSEQLDEFDLRRYVIGYGHQTQTQKFQTPDEVLQKLLPVVETSRSAVLWYCGVSDKGCADLASALRSNSSNLRELDLSWNEVGDSGVKRLSAGLKDPHCKLEKLVLRCCGVSVEGCAALASVLRSNSSNLRELELSENKVGDSGVKLLSAGLKDPQCKLEKLWLWNCGVSDKGCAALASVLRSNSSNLRELELSENNVGDSGVKLLSAGLRDPHCKLEKLWLGYCGVSDKGCAALASALRSNSSNLRELELSENKVGDSGVKRLSAGLKDPHCKLEKLRLRDCGVSVEGCADLASALRSNSSNLRELNLSKNKVGDSGVKLLSAGLKDPHCKLEKLLLRYCGVSDEGCADLASVLRSNSSNLRELDLSYNIVGDSGVKLLSAGLKDPHCKLEKLRLRDCGVSDEGCAALASVLSSNSSNLRELNLSDNKVGDSGVKLLSAGLKDPHCKLEKLALMKCGVSGEGCAALASALRSNSPNLRELNLKWNKLGSSGVKLLSGLRDDPHCKLETLQYK